QAGACHGIFGNRPLRCRAFGKRRGGLLAIRCDPRSGRREPLLFLRSLSRRGGVGGAPTDASFQALRGKSTALVGCAARAPFGQELDSIGRRVALIRKVRGKGRNKFPAILDAVSSGRF